MSEPTLTETIRRRLRALREGRRWSQEQLADAVSKLGVPLHATAITRIERGARRITAEELTAVALALEVTPLALLVDLAAEQASLAGGVQVIPYEALMWLTGRRELGKPLDLEVGEYRPPGMAWGPMQRPALLAQAIDQAWSDIQTWHRSARGGDEAAAAALAKARPGLQSLLDIAAYEQIAIPTEITDYLAAHGDAEEAPD